MLKGMTENKHKGYVFKRPKEVPKNDYNFVKEIRVRDPVGIFFRCLIRHDHGQECHASV